MMAKGDPMHSEINIKIVILLVLLSTIAFISHRIGFLDTSLVIPLEKSNNPKLLIKSASSIAHLEKSSGITLNCQLEKLDGNNYCGAGITLGGDALQDGIDLSAFNKLSLTIKYRAPTDNAKLKISFRNYNPYYSNFNDTVSLKFNSITYNPNLHTPTVEIPFDALQVDNWWVDQYMVGFNHSQVELSNVSFIEVLTDSMKTLGDYRIEIKSIVLYGQLISEANMLKLMLLIWLITAIFLITLQRNKLKRMSLTDTLTGLYNREGIESWTNKKILSRLGKNRLYMFYLDIDDFKKVNDTHGHHVGDLLLIGFSDHIRDYLNSIPNIIVSFARLSGDEFSFVIIGLKENEIENFAEGLLAILNEPIVLKEHEIYARASLGIAELIDDVNNFEGLLSRADSTLYYAKKDGKNRYKVFNESVSQYIFFRKQIAEKVLDAVSLDDFYLNFMPIFDAKTLKIESVEVLLRTNYKALKGIGPDIFIPIAEEYNLIKHIDLWVIEATFKQIVKEKQFLSDANLVFCINISSAELHNPYFVHQLEQLLNLYQISPEIIELELTETSLVEADLTSISTLQEIRALGIKLALDDFGTGYTAFSQLINYPVDYLKIDKSFIDDLDSVDNTKATMIKAIISIADSYQLKTIAEGIEERYQYEFLVEHGCDMIQGSLFGKPMVWNDLKQFINGRKSQSMGDLRLISNE